MIKKLMMTGAVLLFISLSTMASEDVQQTTVDKLMLEQANTLIHAAFIEGKKLDAAPLAIVVLDAGGHLIAFQRQDGAAYLRFDLAFAKAYGALGMGMGSRGLAKRAKKIPHFMEGAIHASQGRLIPAAGGVLILNNAGEVVGAVGVSGDTSDKDERVAVAGIDATGMKSKVD
jgi:uncharacterized protein GlcG (DUF336 family)